MSPDLVILALGGGAIAGSSFMIGYLWGHRVVEVPPPSAPVKPNYLFTLPQDLFASAREAVRVEQERNGQYEAELRRHNVYARLIKQYPGTRKREISQAIEMALELEFPPPPWVP